MSNIVGIGTDIVECLRIANMIERHGERFLRRVYTSSEINHCSCRAHATQHYAACWAGKEAVIQAMQLRLTGGLTMRDIEIYHEVGRRSQVRLGGRARDSAVTQRIRQLQISTSFCRTFASAFVIAVAD